MKTTIVRNQKATNTGILEAAGTALEHNSARNSYRINNLGTNPLFVKEGDGASATDFDYILAAGTANDNGTGATYESPAGQTFIGKVTVAGTSPRFSATEYTEKNNSN